jgi:hypothetical protein
MIRYKYPIEYELRPENLEKGSRWLTLRIKNEGDDKLQYLGIKMHSIDSFRISFRNPSDHIYLLKPDEEKYSSFQVDADGTVDRNLRYYQWLQEWISLPLGIALDT